MAKEKRYRGMSMADIGGYAEALFSYELDGDKTKDRDPESTDAMMEQLLRVSFQDTFPEAPVILGMAADLAQGKLLLSGPRTCFEEAVETLEREIASICAMELTSEDGLDEKELADCFPMVGEAFAAACRYYPRDLDPEETDYAWEFPDEDPLQDFHEAADEAFADAETALRSEKSANPEQVGNILSVCRSIYGHGNRDNPKLWQEVETCLARAGYPESALRSKNRKRRRNRRMLTLALGEVHPDLVRYFLAGCGQEGSGDPQMNRLLSVWEKAFLQAFFASFDMPKEEIEETLRDPVLGHIILFIILGELINQDYATEEGQLQTQEEWEELCEEILAEWKKRRPPGETFH
ncbi:MAG: hypothetical protein ACI4OJ_11300 [Lachnospiraceae bacterium]